MKKKLVWILSIGMAMGLAACGGESQTTSESAAKTQQNNGEKYSVGISWYNYSDTFLSSLRQSLENIAEADGTFELISTDSQGAVESQTSNVNNLYTQGVDIMVVNNVNSSETAITALCQQAQDEDTPLVIFNSNAPSDSDFEQFKNVYCVSPSTVEPGTVMGEAIVDYIKGDGKDTWDRNGNGKFDYIMLLGTQADVYSLGRSEGSIAALTDAGIEVNCIGGEQITDYSRATAQEKVTALLANYSNDIDGVIGCSDDLALGAIEALKAGGFFGEDGACIPVTGVDATEVGCEAIREGTMLVTCLNNPVVLSKGLYKTLQLIMEGKEITQENLGLDGLTVDGHCIWMAPEKVTKENVDDIGYDLNDTDLS